MHNKLWLISTSVLVVLFLGTLLWTFSVQKDNTELTAKLVTRDSTIATQNRVLEDVKQNLGDENKNLQKTNKAAQVEINRLKAQLASSKQTEAAIITKYDKIYEIINSKDSSAQLSIAEELLTRNDQLYQLIQKD